MIKEFYYKNVINGLSNEAFEEEDVKKQDFDQKYEEAVNAVIAEGKYTKAQSENGEMMFSILNQCFSESFLKHTLSQDDAFAFKNRLSDKELMLNGVEGCSDIMDQLSEKINRDQGSVKSVLNQYYHVDSSVVSQNEYKRINIPMIVSFVASIGLAVGGFIASKGHKVTSTEYKYEVHKGFLNFGLGAKEVTGTEPYWFAPYLFIAAVIFLAIGIFLFVRSKKKQETTNSNICSLTTNEISYIEKILFLAKLYQNQKWD